MFSVDQVTITTKTKEPSFCVVGNGSRGSVRCKRVITSKHTVYKVIGRECLSPNAPTVVFGVYIEESDANKRCEELNRGTA